MYHGSGDDWKEPFELFAPTISDFWLVDIGYFQTTSATASWPLLSASKIYKLKRRDVVGPPTSTIEWRDHRGGSYPHIDPCLLTEEYLHTASGAKVTMRRRRGYGQRTLPLINRLGVFIQRGDSPGECGSGVRWLSRRRINDLLCHLLDGGLIATDGSLSDARETHRFHDLRISSKSAFEKSREFCKWGYAWRPVGWMTPQYGPTLIWKVTAI